MRTNFIKKCSLKYFVAAIVIVTIGLVVAILANTKKPDAPVYARRFTEIAIKNQLGTYDQFSSIVGNNQSQIADIKLVSQMIAQNIDEKQQIIGVDARDAKNAIAKANKMINNNQFDEAYKEMQKASAIINKSVTDYKKQHDNDINLINFNINKALALTNHKTARIINHYIDGDWAVVSIVPSIGDPAISILNKVSNQWVIQVGIGTGMTTEDITKKGAPMDFATKALEFITTEDKLSQLSI